MSHNQRPAPKQTRGHGPQINPEKHQCTQVLWPLPLHEAHISQMAEKSIGDSRSGNTVKWLKWIIPTTILAAFTFGYFRLSGETLEKMVWDWVIPNAFGAGVLAMVAGARPLSIIAAFIASPITSLNPTIGAGMVVGLLEAWLRKPTVGDAERLTTDMNTIGGVYRNQFSRVLLVALLTTIGSSLGALVAWPSVLGPIIEPLMKLFN